MKKKTIKALAVLLAAVMMALLFTGCRNDQDITVFEPPEYVYVPEIIRFPELPDGAEEINQIVIAGETVFFTSWGSGGGDTTISGTRLFSMSIDGTNLNELPNYDPGFGAPPEAEGGHININSMSADRDGNLWVVESGNFFRFDLPDDFVEDPENEGERWNYYRELGSVNAIRKLDSSGAEILSVDISAIADGDEWFWVRTFATDEAGNLYIGSDNRVNVMSPEGRPLFRLEVQGWVDALLATPDGSVAKVGWGETGLEMRLIDLAAGTWGDSIEGIPPNVSTILPGNDEFLFVYNTATSLFGFNADTGESELILNWIDSEVSPEGLSNITFLEDGRLVVTTQTWRGMGGPVTDLVFLTKARYEDLPERTVLTLAAFWIDWNVRNAVIEFNRASTTHRIHVIDYGQYSTEDDRQAGLTRLTTEMIAGNVPDILDISSLPHQQYMARGLLTDLYTFIDADPELSRGGLMESVFQAIEVNGELPFIFPSFSVFTLAGSSAVLGPEPGWNMAEFDAVLAANPQADMPAGQWLTREQFLSMSFMLGMNNFVDWGAGTVNFDDGGFAALLETSNAFPPQRDDMFGEEFFDWVEMVALGRQIMEFASVWSFNDIQRYAAVFGGDVVYKGFPTENRDGHTLLPGGGLAITTRSVDPEGAWSFVRTLLTEDWQGENVQWNFPTNRAVFDARADEAMNPPPEMGEITTWVGDMQVELEPLTQAQLNQLLALFDSVSGTFGHDETLWNIVSEGASDFFSGQSSAADVSRIIQSRAAIYVSEQS